ncbi:hypothetical protein Tco_0048429, partial [Tanacetum coccineum]
KKVVGLREAEDINGGHYVSRIAHNLGYCTSNEIKKCSALVEGTLLDKKTLRAFFDSGKIMIKENDVVEKKGVRKPKAPETKTQKVYKEQYMREKAKEVEKTIA